MFAIEGGLFEKAVAEFLGLKAPALKPGLAPF
jgi:hypothetical protein